MGNLSDKLTEVIQFLETTFPGRRIVTAFNAEQPVIALPEIRLRLEKVTDSALLHWEVEFAPQPSIQLTNQVDDIQTLRNAVGNSSKIRIGTGKSVAKSRHWIEELLQPWTPEGVIPQHLYAQSTPFATTTALHLSNETSINDPVIIETPPVGEFPCYISDSSGSIFLGNAIFTQGELILEYSPGRDFPGGSTLCFLSEGVVFSNAAMETDHHNFKENARSYQTMDGTWRKAHLAPTTWEKKLQFPLLTSLEISDWKQFRENLETIPNAFLVSRTRSVFNATPVQSQETGDPGGLTGSLDITLKCSTLEEGGA